MPGKETDAGSAPGVLDDVRASFAALVTSFRSPDIAKVIGAYVGFTVTEWAAFIALIVYAYRDGGTVMVGLVGLLQMIPAAAIAPVAAVLGDRHRRERVLLLGYGLLATMIGIAAFALLSDAPALLVYLSGTAAGWTMTLIRPAHASLLPRLARGPEELSSAYSASALLESSSALLGPVLAGGLMAAANGSVSGPGLVDAALTLLLVVGTVAVATVRTRTDPANETVESGLRVVAAEAADGVRSVTRDRRALLLTSMMGLALVELGFVDVLLVVLAVDVLGTGEAGVGFLTAAIGIGAVVGVTVSLGFALRWRSSSAFRWGATLGGLSVAGIAAQPALAGGLLALSGAGASLADVNGRIMLQRLMPDKQLSRAFGVLESLYMAGEGIGSFVGSLLIVAVGPRWTLLVAGLMVPTVAFLARRRLAALDVGVRVPSAEIAVLRATPIFAPLPTPMLERLARNLVPLALPERSVVIRQGEPGDRFYTIVEGRVTVEADGGHVGTLAAGEAFGEIALLRDVPRTATVTASTAVRLLSLDRDEFLRAVTGHEPAETAAQDLATGRLDDLETRRER
jgi:MFS family permease